MDRIEAPHLENSHLLLGIDPTRISIAYIDQQSRLPLSTQTTLIDALTDADHALVRDSLLLGPQTEGGLGHQGEYFSRLLMPQDSEAAIAGCTQAAYAMAVAHPDVHLVFPMAGAIPLAKKVHALGLAEQRMSAVEINGTIGAKTGEATVRGQLPQEVLDPNRFVLMVDDMGFVSAVRLAIERKKYRLNTTGLPYDERADKTLLQQLKTASHTSSDSASVYKDFAALCREEKVLPLPVFSKNPKAIRALSGLAGADGADEWSHRQQEAMDSYAVVELPDRWVLGAGLLDVAIKLEDIVKKLPPQFHGHPVVADWTGKKVLLRLGVPVPGLVYVNPQQIEKMTQLLAKQVAVQLGKSRTSNETSYSSSESRLAGRVEKFSTTLEQ